MALDKKAFDDAAEIQKAFEQHFSNVENVVGIGLGLNKAADAPAINVQLAKPATRSKLPRTFQGLDVVIDVVGEIKAQ